MKISPLKLETENERRIYNQGQENYNKKKQLAKTTLRKQTPNDEESDLIHALWLEQMDYSSKAPKVSSKNLTHIPQTPPPPPPSKGPRTYST